MKRVFFERRASSAATRDPADRDLDAEADGELLRRFTTDRCDRAFAQLVARHGAMVMAVCRRTLQSEADAEDAFQAAFLVLARKAGSLRKTGSLAAWLYQTAYRIALRARVGKVRRREQPLEIEPLAAKETACQLATDYEYSIVDDEMNRLPDKYRLPLFLCCVEGKSLDEAAAQLGWSIGSVKGRLERGRQKLRGRLLFCRVSPLATVAVLASLHQTAQASQVVAPALVAATTQGAVQFAAGQSVLGYVTHHALTLAEGSLKLMALTTTTKLIAGSAVVAATLAWGGTRILAPAFAAGDGDSVGTTHTVTVYTAPAAASDNSLLALAEEEGPRRGPREGQGPARTGPRDGEGAPRTGARDGEGAPRTGLRDGERPAASGLREGAPRTGPREGDAPRTGFGEGSRAVPRGGEEEGDPLADFKPATKREAVLLQMIKQLRGEIQALKGEGPVSPNKGFRPAARDGEGGPRTGPRDGEGGPRTGPRDGEGPPRTGPRDGEGAPRTGPRDGEGGPRTGPRDGEGPAKSGPREGDAPKAKKAEG